MTTPLVKRFGICKSEESYVHNCSDKPLQYTTVGNVLEKAAAEVPNKVFVVSCHQSIKKTYAELNAEVDRLISSYHRLGLVKGDIVAVWGKNSYEWILTAFSLAKAGIIMVTVCPAFKEMEVQYILETVPCKAVIILHDSDETNYFDILCRIDSCFANAAGSHLNIEKLPHLKTVIYSGKQYKQGTIWFDDLLKTPVESLGTDTQIKVSPDDIIFIQFTSGTTGRPKPASISHFAIINNGRFFAEKFHMNNDLVVCCPVPLYHMFGLLLTMGSVLSQQGTLVLPSTKFEPLPALEAIETERCTVLLGVEAMLMTMMNLSTKRTIDFSSLKIVSMGGSIFRPEVIAQVQQFFDAKPLIGYGITETSGPVTNIDYYDRVDLSSEGFCGSVMDHTEVKIVDAKGIVPVGYRGEILVRGYQVFLGYYCQEKYTKEVIDDNRWYRTGDLGYIDEKGYLHVVARIKDMIIRGGVNIYPAEIEDYILRHPAVRNVVVVGVPDSKLGEQVCACIISDPDANLTTEHIKSFLKEKISYFKIPKYCLFMDYLPQTPSGKVMKREVSKLALQQLKISEGLSFENLTTAVSNGF